MASVQDFDLEIEKTSVQSKLNKAINEVKKTKDKRYGKKLHCIPKCKYLYHHEKMASEEQEMVKKEEAVKKDAEQPMSNDLEDGLFKMTNEYEMMMLRVIMIVRLMAEEHGVQMGAWGMLYGACLQIYIGI